MIRLMLCSVLICTFAPALAPADDKTPDKNANVKTFDVPGHGALRLSIPAGWTSNANQPPIASLPPTIEISVESAQGQKPACQMLITPMASRTKDGNSLADLKRGAEARGKQLLPGSKESKIDIKDLKGAQAAGYYFTVTDKAPNPGEYENMTCAFVGVGNFALAVTILHHQKDSPHLQAALDCLKSASQSNTDKAQGDKEQKGSVLRISPPGASGWELIIAGKNLQKIDDQSDAARKVRQVSATDTDSDLIVSVFIEPALNKGDSTAVRSVYWGRAQRSPMTKKNIKLGKEGEYATVDYLVTDVAGIPANQKNLNVYIAHEGYWIDVHVSKMDFKQSDQAQFDELVKSLRFENTSER